MIPVVITTDKDKRGVFFGYIKEEDATKDKMRVEQVQMCVYWARGVRGVVGLAVHGPNKESRVTSPAKAGIVDGVTLVLEASDEAVKAWKSQPWG